MKKNKLKAPSFAEKLLKWILPASEKESITGDYEELYFDLFETKGEMFANLWYWLQVFKSAWSVLTVSLYWNFVMFKSYLKIAARNIRKQKVYSFINISGLAAGLACCFLILIWVTEETGYDSFHKNASDLYIVTQKMLYSDRETSSSELTGAVAKTLEREYPEIKEAARVFYLRKFLFRYEGRRFIEKKILAVDPEFLKMFSFPLTRGNKKAALNNPNSVVISRKTAEKYFGGENALGKILNVDNLYNLTVSGILEEPVKNTHLKFDILVPMTSELIIHEKEIDVWHREGDFYTYVLLQKNTPPHQTVEKIADLLQKHIRDCPDKLSLYPVTKLHTNIEYSGESNPIDIRYIYIFSIIALIVLLIACFNFMNLSTARFSIRAKEIGMRKVVGANRKYLVYQFLGESILITFIAAIIAVLIIKITIPVFNSYTGGNLSPDLWENRQLFLTFFVITLFTGIIAGSYPAWYLSGLHPVSILRGSLTAGANRLKVRRILVIIQFSMSVILIVGTIVVYEQLNFMKNKDVGYDSENLITIPMTMSWEQGVHGPMFETFRNELINHPGIAGVTQSFSSPSSIMTSRGEADWEGRKPGQTAEVCWLTAYYDYLETLGIEIIEGRSFSREYSSDMGTFTKVSFIINEEAVKMMGVKSAVGLNFELYSKKGPIIGVMKNFHFRHMKTKILPMAIFIIPYWNENIIIKLNSGNTENIISFIKNTWIKFVPDYPFEYSFVNEEITGLYSSEELTRKLMYCFTFLAILIACSGLLGLTLFTIGQRTKEIGIRKILGASIPEVVFLLSVEFMKWIVIANIIAWPVIFVFMRMWLQNFAYHIDMEIWIFLLSGIVTTLIALLTIIYQAVKAANTNPVNALKYE